jgi:hypothetical protein
MKLFVWEGNMKVLAQYADGTAWALAESLEQAIELIVNKYKVEEDKDNAQQREDALIWKHTPYEKHETDELRKELESKEPDVYDQPVALYVYGSA